MAHSVSVLDGEVNRNWNLVDSNGERHLLSLFHDCVTGARAAMLDYEASSTLVLVIVLIDQILLYCVLKMSVVASIKSSFLYCCSNSPSMMSCSRIASA